MAVPYEKIVAEDLNRGVGSVSVTMPAGGSATGSQIGIHSFLQNAFNALDYGAVGDGVADDTAAVQAALDGTPSGGLLIMPFGYNFNLRSTLTVSKPLRMMCGAGTMKLGGSPGIDFTAGAGGTEIIGMGRGITTFETTHTSASVFRVGATGVHFRDFDLFANPASTRAGTLIEPNALQGHVERVRVRGTNSFNCGRMFNHVGPSPLGGEWTYRDIEMTGGLFTDGWRTFSAQGTMAGLIIDNPICYIGVTFTHAMFNFDGGTDTVIVRAAQCGATVQYTVHCQNTTSGPGNIDPRWIHFIDCRLEAGGQVGTGIVVQIDAVRDFRYLCGYMTSGQNAVVINGGIDIDISHNEIGFMGQDGIILNADQTTTGICNNNFVDIGTNTHNTHDYIQVAANLQGFRIEANGFSQVDANKARYGINLLSGSGNFFTINGNDFSKAAIGTAYLFNGASGSTQVIFGNLGIANYVSNGAFGRDRFNNTVEAVTALWIAGQQVVGPQGAAVPDASGGATIDAEARAAINSLLARMRAHGIIG